jgi:hypothetical protein
MPNQPNNNSHPPSIPRLANSSRPHLTRQNASLSLGAMNLLTARLRTSAAPTTKRLDYVLAESRQGRTRRMDLSLSIFKEEIEDADGEIDEWRGWADDERGETETETESD